jgi:hypothetical protein
MRQRVSATVRAEVDALDNPVKDNVGPRAHDASIEGRA